MPDFYRPGVKKLISLVCALVLLTLVSACAKAPYTGRSQMIWMSAQAPCASEPRNPSWNSKG